MRTFFDLGGLDFAEDDHDRAGILVAGIHSVLGAKPDAGAPEVAPDPLDLTDGFGGAARELHLGPVEQLGGPFVLRALQLQIKEEGAAGLQEVVDRFHDGLDKNILRIIGGDASQHDEIDVFFFGFAEPRVNIGLNVFDAEIFEASRGEERRGVNARVFVDGDDFLNVIVEDELVPSGPGHAAGTEVDNLGRMPTFAVVFNRGNEVRHKELALTIVDERRHIADEILNCVLVDSCPGAPFAADTKTCAVSHFKSRRRRGRYGHQPREEIVRDCPVIVQDELRKGRVFFNHRTNEVPDFVQTLFGDFGVCLEENAVNLVNQGRVGNRAVAKLFVSDVDVFDELVECHFSSPFDGINQLVMSNHFEPSCNFNMLPLIG